MATLRTETQTPYGLMALFTSRDIFWYCVL